MENQIVEFFKETFNKQAQVVSKAPGRLEVLGNHTDYNEGYVLSVAVDSYTSIALAASSSLECRVFSPDIEDRIRTFSLDQISKPRPEGDWTNYIRGVICEFHKLNLEIKGFDAVIQSTVPFSAGMSSSASFEMALVSGLCKLFDIELSLIEQAKIGQGCENNYIGANTGLMDQFTSLAGKSNHLVLSEYRQHSINTIHIPAGYTFAVFNSGVQHDLSLEYNERRVQCEKAVKLLKESYPEIHSLRDISLEQLKKYEEKMPKTLFKRALHIVGENDRVHKAVECLKNNEIDEFGQLLFDSHKSSIENFENSCDELDFLIALAEGSHLCLGARLSGGGFGGISIHLVKVDQVEHYIDIIQHAFKKEYGTAPQTFICKSADGASAITL